MEHSALHALQLCGMVVALGGPILILGIFFPACRFLGTSASGVSNPFAKQLESTVTRWVFIAALVGATASFLTLFVDVAELKNKTIFGGVSPKVVWRFATVTTVGHLSLGRIAALLLTAAAIQLRGSLKWWLALVFATTAVVFAGLVCHAAAQPTGRATAIAMELTHILAASVWLGVLIHLLFARRAMESATQAAEINLIAEIVRRFSPVAFTAVVLIALSGIIAVVRFLVTPAAIPTSAYGLTFAVKLTLLIPLLYAGWVNFKIIRPAFIFLSLKGNSGTTEKIPLIQRFGRMLELEVTAGVLVIIVAGILASVSPPGEESALRLTDSQSHALFATIHLPRTQIADPVTFYGASERTVDDLRYAEFMHNWSGMAVFLLGLCWLAQSFGGRASWWAERLWPFCMIPFALFIAVAADPEVWILRKVSLAYAFTDPSLIEHQIGALMVFVIAWLGWRDLKKPAARRPLGYALPVLMIAGSLLLLGHAHSNLTATQGLTNLINVQHAIFGMFGLFAGTARWFNLRGLFPNRAARILWPGFVIALGLVMVFCYREII